MYNSGTFTGLAPAPWTQSRRDGRRLDARMPYPLQVRYRLDHGPFQRAHLEDVSGGGLRMTLEQELPKGSRLQILYHQPLCWRHQWVEGEVRWSKEWDDSYLIGIEVDFISDYDERRYRQLVDQLATVRGS